MWGLIVFTSLIVLVDGSLLAMWAVRQFKIDRGEAVQSIFSPKWSVVDVWLAAHIIAIALAIPTVALFMLILPAAVKGGPNGGMDVLKSETGMLYTIVFTVYQQVVMSAVPLVFIRKKYRLNFRDIGLKWPTKREWALGIGCGFVLLVGAGILENTALTFIQAFAPKSVMTWITETQKSLGIEQVLGSIKSPFAYVGMFIVGAIGAPISEEIFFRGMLFNSAKQRFGLTAGLVISSLVFSIAHLGPLSIIAIFPMGLFLAYVYNKTGSLAVPIIMHATNNSIAILATFLLPHAK
jgi:membrane protease YdiL (CAAX protease family)